MAAIHYINAWLTGVYGTFNKKREHGFLTSCSAFLHSVKTTRQGPWNAITTLPQLSLNAMLHTDFTTKHG